jgi:hypothetical protein
MKQRKELTIYVVGALLIFIAVALLGAQKALASGSGGPIQAPVSWHMQSGAGPVEGAWASLNTRANGASFTFHATQLKPGHVYTIWFVAINAPENCASIPCGPADIILNSEATQSNVTYGAGHVVGMSGQAAFAGFIPAGEMPDGWFPTAFTNPLGAEIHLVLNDHGSMIPELVSNMLHTYRGGCTDESLPPIFPATAFADGIPGPNTCRLYQVAIFQQ